MVRRGVIPSPPLYKGRAGGVVKDGAGNGDYMDFMKNIKACPRNIKRGTISFYKSFCIVPRFRGDDVWIPAQDTAGMTRRGDRGNDRGGDRGNDKGQSDERGFVLVLAIIIMAAMTAIGLAVVTTSTTDMMIARNEMESKKAFYLAQSGLEEAIGRMNLLSASARFVGESSEQKTHRKSGGGTAYAGQTFYSHSGANALNPTGLGGTYEVRVDYTRENAATWCNDAGCSGTHLYVTSPTAEEIVLYCTGWGFIGSGVMINCPGGQPVYKVTSTGTTASGTVAKIVAYVASSSLNVVPPGNTILFTEGAIDIGGGGSINGVVASDENTVGGDGGCVASCVDESATTAWTNPPDTMNNYIGVDIVELKNMADYPSPYDQSLATDTYSPAGQWGEVCAAAGDGTAGDIATHICEK